MYNYNDFNSFVEVAAHHAMNLSAALSASGKVRYFSVHLVFSSMYCRYLCGDRLLYKITQNHLRPIYDLLMRCSQSMEMVQCIGL